MVGHFGTEAEIKPWPPKIKGECIISQRQGKREPPHNAMIKPNINYSSTLTMLGIDVSFCYTRSLFHMLKQKYDSGVWDCSDILQKLNTTIFLQSLENLGN